MLYLLTFYPGETKDDALRIIPPDEERALTTQIVKVVTEANWPFAIVSRYAYLVFVAGAVDAVGVMGRFRDVLAVRSIRVLITEVTSNHVPNNVLATDPIVRELLSRSRDVSA